MDGSFSLSLFSFLSFFVFFFFLFFCFLFCTTALSSSSSSPVFPPDPVCTRGRQLYNNIHCSRVATQAAGALGSDSPLTIETSLAGLSLTSDASLYEGQLYLEKNSIVEVGKSGGKMGQRGKMERRGRTKFSSHSWI